MPRPPALSRTGVPSRAAALPLPTLLLPRLLLLGFAASGGLVACGGDPPHADDAGRLLRPELHPLTDAPMPSEIVDRLPVPEGLGKWTLTGREATTPVGSDGARIVAGAPGDEPAFLSVPGRFPIETTDLVRVRGVFPGQYRLTLQMSGPQGDPFRPPTIETRNDPGEQTLEFSLDKLLGRGGWFETLDLLLDGSSDAFEVRAIELVDAPEGLFLPRPGDPPDMLDLDNGRGRSGNGLTRDVPIVTRFPVEAAGDRLTFAVALAPRMRPWNGSPRVQVAIGPVGEPPRTRTIELEAERKTPLEWHESAIDLADWVGREVEARFEYLCESPQAGAAILAEVQVGRPRLDPPTVVLVSSDTHRADHVHASGSGVVLETPTLDGLAGRGVLFEQCWSSTNVTSPSHVAILTGVHPRDTRLVTNIDRLSPLARTAAEAFRDAGWATIAAVSVRHLGPRGTNLGQGFDRMLAPTSEPWPAQVPVDQLLEWIDEEQGKPLFVFLHLFDAHHPYEPPAEYDRRYYPADRDPYDPAQPAVEAQPGCMPMDFLQKGLRDLEYPRAQYRAEVSYLDAQLGRLFAVPRVDAGLIAVTADHGEILEKRGSYFNHGELYPDTLHVPLIVSGGALAKDLRGRRVKARVNQLDLGRTLLDLAGLGSVEFPGDNLLRALDEPVDAAPAHFSLSANGNSASIADGDWFLVLHLRKHKSTMPGDYEHDAVELFDLAHDPECLTDVHAENADVVEGLRGRLIEWLDAAPATSLSMKRVASQAELQQLQELGYATDAEVVGLEPWYEAAPRGKGADNGSERKGKRRRKGEQENDD